MPPNDQPLKNSFHPAPKPSEKAQKAPATPSKPLKPSKPPAPKKPAQRKAVPKKKLPKKKPVPAAESRAYRMARDRCKVTGGYLCEHANHFIPDGQEHAHHIIYGRAHGSRSAMTDPDLLAIVCGDFTGEDKRCHQKIHQAGIKDLTAFPYWRGQIERFESLSR